MGIDPNGYQYCFAEQTTHMIDGPRCMGGGSTTGGWGPMSEADTVLTIELGGGLFGEYFGIGVVINLTDRYVETYGIVGACLGCTINLNVGLIGHVDEPGEYKDGFVSGAIAYGVGIGRSQALQFDEGLDVIDEDGPNTTYITFSPPGGSISATNYIWNEDHVYHWGD